LTFHSIARTAGVVAMATALLGSALAPPTPAHAELPEIRNHLDPYARVVVEITRIIVHDDFDWGDAEVAINFQVATKPLFGACPKDGDDTECATPLVQGGVPEFTPQNHAKQLDRVVPSYLDTIPDGSDATSAFGIPIRPRQSYTLIVKGFERDPIEDDILGVLRFQLDDNNNHVRFGTHKERATGACEKYPIARDDCWAQAKGAFTVEFEVRPAPLPDLETVGITVLDLPGSPTKLVCPTIKNSGLADAGAFEMTLHIDGAAAPAGKMTAGRLGTGEQGELCVEAALPKAGEHQLLVEVDRAEAQIEFNERNNSYSQAYVAGPATGAQAGPGTGSASGNGEPGPANTPSPTPVPTGAADLSTGALRVNGQAPDGKEDCKDGKNAVSLVVKNGGKAGAEGFVVRLAVDGNQAGEASVEAIEAGKEREVRFGDVKLKTGEHQLSATVDAKGEVAEANEENNVVTVTVRCQGGS